MDAYWVSLAIVAAIIFTLTLIGVVVIRLVGRADERRLARSALPLYTLRSQRILGRDW